MEQPSSAFRSTLHTPRRHILSRSQTLGILDGLHCDVDQAAIKYLPPGLAPAEVERHVKGLDLSPNISTQLVDKVISSKTGGLIIRGSQRCVLIFPPLPLGEECLTGNAAMQALRLRLEKDHLTALVLVRLGAYAIGIYRGERRLSSKVGTGLIHARHRQGGSSSRRFQRHREKQIEYFLTRVCEHARTLIEPRMRELDCIVYGGAWTTIQLLRKQCPLLNRLKIKELPPLLDIPEPKQAVLEEAASRVWSSTVLEWIDSPGTLMTEP
ncbi:MAG: Vms1/Ankzf1 family peptidyl-tRNA hydrolase [Dehalococcoidales bacterium]|nr:Vms1/Ankzf1 family peptidyl-tRNA hydrolase [Dehalococcoidales bacterium]